MSDRLIVRGARQHNLKNISIDIPRDKMVVFTGLSGSGKSSLAFDTIYAEGQRRYVESLSAYARQFLGQKDPPDVDFIEGLSPAISIDQKSASSNPRSTVGTMTEVYDYLRLLYARIGVQHCPNDGTKLALQTPEEIVDRVLTLDEGTRFMVLAPVVKGRKGEYEALLNDFAGQGFVRARIDGEIVDITEFLKNLTSGKVFVYASTASTAKFIKVYLKVFAKRKVNLIKDKHFNLFFDDKINEYIVVVFFGKKRVPETAILEIVAKKLLTSYQDVMLVYPDGVDYDEDSALFG
jgi:excinuclease UvrABC ATPase subunit